MKLAVAASEEEINAVYRQRYTVYVQEINLYRDWADHEQKRLTDADDATARLLYAEENGVVVASLRLHMGHDHPLPQAWIEALKLDRFTQWATFTQMAFISRFTINNEYRSSSLSFKLVAMAYEMGCREGIVVAFLDCLPHLIPLYSRLGFRRYGDEIVDPDVGILSPMCLVVRDTMYLKTRRSPFLQIAMKHMPAEQSPEWIAQAFPPPSPSLGTSSESDAWSETLGILSAIPHGRHRAFTGFSGEEIKPLLERGQVINCKAGDRFILAGTAYDNIYIILRGTCEIRSGGRVIGLASEGDLVGEMAFLLNAPRTADVVALSHDVRVLSLTTKDTRLLLENDPRIASKFLLNLSRILAERLFALRQLVPREDGAS